ncbi:unnamed protein product [Urochloa decumbens]|uniref:F-box domain-containing protein n=1 Tax=Urochloa decumbens TaxID=240449 RepID=A0ABC9FN99_9POAL
MMPPPALPELMDDLVEEILLRIPPDDPASLIHAELVCKRWRRIVSDPGFRHRLRELLRHRAHPPILTGFLCNLIDLGLQDIWTNPIDCGLFVWDPATDHVTTLPKLPPHVYGGSESLSSSWKWNTTVLCAGGSACDRHRLGCCGRKPFIIVVVGGGGVRNYYSCVYSSEDGAWSNGTYTLGHNWGPQRNIAMAMPTALVGKSLYFSNNIGIIRFNLDTQGVCMISLPPDCVGNSTVLMTTEGGERLGLATVVRRSKLFLYSGVTSPDGKVVRWDVSRVIELGTVLPAGALASLYRRHVVVGIADDIGVIFLRRDDGIFTLYLNSGHVKKVYKDTVYIAFFHA